MILIVFIYYLFFNEPDNYHTPSNCHNFYHNALLRNVIKDITGAFKYSRINYIYDHIYVYVLNLYHASPIVAMLYTTKLHHRRFCMHFYLFACTIQVFYPMHQYFLSVYIFNIIKEVFYTEGIKV
jgi:hypothetical protein